MWTKANRGKYHRDGVRYPSDLTNAEWALVEPLIPPAKRGGRRREVEVREVLNGLLYVLARAANGGPCRRTCRRRARYSAISTCGTGMARSAVFTRNCT